VVRKFLAFYRDKSSLVHSQAPTRSIQPSIPLLLFYFSNQTKQRQRTLIKHPAVNSLKISSLTTVHYMQTDRYVAALLPIVIANSPKVQGTKVQFWLCVFLFVSTTTDHIQTALKSTGQSRVLWPVSRHGIAC